MKERVIAIGLLIAAAVTALVLWLKKKEEEPEPPLPDFCVVDNDCPTGYHCVSGECIKIPEEPPGAYEIRLSELKISSPISIGIPVYISCKAVLKLALVGVPVTRAVSLFINGVEVQSQNVTLTREHAYDLPSTTVEFAFIPQEAKTYNVELDGLEGSFEVPEVAIENYITLTGIELIQNLYPELEAALVANGLNDKWRKVYSELLKTSIELEDAHAYYDGVILSGNATVSHYDGVWAGKYPGFTLRLYVVGATMPHLIFAPIPLQIRFSPFREDLVKFTKGEEARTIPPGTYPITIKAEMLCYYRKPNGLMSKINRVMKTWRVGELKI